MNPEIMEAIRTDRTILLQRLIADFKRMRWNMKCRKGGVKYLESLLSETKI